MKRLILLFCALGLALGPTNAETQVLDSPVEQLRLTGVGSGVVANWDNVYIGPYDGMLVSDPTQPALTLYCVDFAHSVSVGDTWYANVTGLTGGSDYSETRLSGEAPATSQVRYRQAAFLASLFESNTGRANWSGIHAAIWRIMTPGFPNIAGVNNPTYALNQAQPWIDMAERAAADGFVGMNFAEWQILTDVASEGHVGGRQEFLARATVTPEPETWALMITGLLLLAFFGRRRIREMSDAA